MPKAYKDFNNEKFLTSFLWDPEIVEEIFKEFNSFEQALPFLNIILNCSDEILSRLMNSVELTLKILFTKNFMENVIIEVIKVEKWIILKIILGLFPSSTHLLLAQQMIVIALKRGRNSMIKAVLGMLSVPERLTLFRRQIFSGGNLLHISIFSNNDELLKIIFDLCPLGFRLGLLKEKNLEEDGTVLRCAAKSSNPKFLITILENIPDAKQINILLKGGVIFLAIRNKNPAILEVVLNKISTKDRSYLLTAKDKEGSGIMHQIARYSNHAMWEMVLKFYDEKNRDLIINQKNNNGTSPLNYKKMVGFLEKKCNEKNYFFQSVNDGKKEEEFTSVGERWHHPSLNH